MASILPFIRPNDGVFDDQATLAMGEAFGAAREQVGNDGQAVYEGIAARIIAAATGASAIRFACAMPD